MYTQCPDCATVFRITAEALRVAQGDVRCGVCSTSFNALENLSERAFDAGAEEEAPSADDSMTVEELPGGENIELSAPPELAAVPEASPEPLPVPADEEAAALEFHCDAADLDRLFVVEDPSLASLDPGAVAANLPTAETLVDPDSTDEHPILVLEESDDPGRVESIVLETIDPEPRPVPAAAAAPAAAVPRATAPPTAPTTPTTHTTHTAPRILIPEEMRKRLAEEAAAREEAARLFEPDEDPGMLAGRHWPWVAGTTALALLLAVQVVHARRNELVRSPSVGPALAGVYDALGLSVLAPTDLSAYELRQWGAASDPREPNRLLLRASIVNRAGYSQPLPLLRLTLHDRFGGTLGERDIGPADYLPGSGAQSLLEPGQRADALIRIVDPGTEAVGFELDICLPAEGGVRCANQVKVARP